MELGLKNRAAAVAASSQGLGFAVALELAREGARVAICSRDQGRIDAAALRIRDQVDGADVHSAVVDLSREDDCRRFINDTAEHFGRLDILLTNSGGPVPGMLDEITLDDIRDGIDSTLMSAIIMMKEAVPHMRSNGFGRIVNVLSMTVKQPKTNLLVSNTMRPGILGFAKSISGELASQNITVNNLAPGYTRTERLDELADHVSQSSGTTPDAVFADWEATSPMRRLGTPEEFAAAAVFLMSERASYITGVTLQVDGGYTLGLF